MTSASSPTGFTLGQQVILAATFANSGGTLTDCTVALTIRTPDGVETVYTASVVHDSVGTYHYDYVTTQSGEHSFRWVASGALVGAYEGTFYVLRSEF